MLIKTQITFLALCMSFITINGFSPNNLRTIISKFDVYRIAGSFKLYQVVRSAEIAHDRNLIPVIVYHEVDEIPKKRKRHYRKFKPHGHNFEVATEEEFLADKMEYYTSPIDCMGK